MSNPNDFDILPDDEEEGIARASRLWLWLLIAAGAVFIFAVGMALATFTNRLGGSAEVPATATPPLATAVAEVPTAAPSATLVQPTATAAAQLPGVATATAALPTQNAPAPAAPMASEVPRWPPGSASGWMGSVVAPSPVGSHRGRPPRRLLRVPGPKGSARPAWSGRARWRALPPQRPGVACSCGEYSMRPVGPGRMPRAPLPRVCADRTGRGSGSAPPALAALSPG